MYRSASKVRWRSAAAISVSVGLLWAGAALAQLPVHHYEYVFPDGNIYVYDIDNRFALAKHINVPTHAGVRGAVASAITGRLYVSYGSDALGGWMLAYDLRHDVVLWQQHYSFGIDSPSVTPDGKWIYMPDGELSNNGFWELLDASTGGFLGSIKSNGLGPHNTVVPPKGAHVYMGPRFSNYLAEASTSSNKVLKEIGPVLQGVRPFVINGPETFAFITTTRYLGFQVGNITTGKIIYTVPVRGFRTLGGQSSALTHGISLSPTGKELYLIDSVNNYVHVFDVTPLPGASPRQIADIRLRGTLYGVKPNCAYDCLREGWLHHSGDGRYVFVGDAGDVISTASRSSIAMLPAMTDSRVEIEIDFQGGSPVSAMNNRASGDLPGWRVLSCSPTCAHRFR
jgi:hypothetical protein